MSYKIAALYRFTPVQDVQSLRDDILDFSRDIDGLCGTLLLAAEGINGTIGARPAAMDRMIDFLDRRLGILRGEVKFSAHDRAPFNRFKLKVKKEIVTLRRPEANPNIAAGDYVDAADWNALIADPEVLLIDTRNDYETRVGIFKGARDPQLKSFPEFPAWVEKHLDPARDKKVAMFCTGGIRCEKASAYMKAQGFEKVYHLKGGILKYLETVPADQSLWQGDCFVFDKRVAVGHGLEKSGWTLCHGCREPLSEKETQRAEYEEGVSCHHCHAALDDDRRRNLRARHRDFLKRHAPEKTEAQSA